MSNAAKINIRIKKLTLEDIQKVQANEHNTGLLQRRDILKNYLDLQNRHHMMAIVALLPDAEPIGYATFVYNSAHSTFSQRQIPEISDIHVAKDYQGHGVGQMLLESAERLAKAMGFSCLGLGIRLYAEHSPTQRLFASNGYIPEGTGLFYAGKPVLKGENVCIDDNLVLYLAKELK